MEPQPLPLSLPNHRTPKQDRHPRREPVLALTSADLMVLKQIADYIASPPVPEGSRVFILTPAVCQALLRDYNKGNRTKKPTAIRRYAKNMRKTRWGKTGDTVKFSDLALLRDGQNRLYGCIDAGVPFETHIVFGIEDHLFARMDTGSGRGGADTLQVGGYSNTTMLSAALRWIKLLETRRVKTRDTLENEEKLDLIKQEYPTLPEFTLLARHISDTSRQPPGALLALVYLFHKINPKRAAVYCDAWTNGKWGGEFKAIEFMQATIARIRQENAGNMNETLRMALMIQAWNAWYLRIKVKPSDMAWTATTPFPDIAGLPLNGAADDDADADDDDASE